MGKKLIKILLTTMMIFGVAGCSSSDTADEEPVTPTDEDFITNISKGLNERWRITDSDEYNETAVASMSTSDTQEAYKMFVETELDAIGDLNDYEFEDDNLKELAETYVNALNLQVEGSQYQGTDDYTNIEKTWALGRKYRIITLDELNTNYTLRIDDDYKQDLDDLLAEANTAKQDVAVLEFAEELEQTLEYEKNEDESDDMFTIYEAVIENTTDYDIDYLSIDIDFIDSDGVITYQSLDSISNFKAGSKAKSQIIYDISDGEFEKMQFTVEASIY